MRRSSLTVVLLAVAGLSVSDAAHAGKVIRIEEAAPPAEIFHEFEFSNELVWYYQTDVGVLLAYGDGKLHRVDLLADPPERMPAMDVPDLTGRNSVVPIAKTGLLFIPSALPARAEPRTAAASVPRSYAIDSLSGKILWESTVLPPPNTVFSYPDAGVAVFRSVQGGGLVYAVDMLSGEKLWEIAKPAAIIWTEDRFARFVSQGELLTVDVFSGETVRKTTLTIPGGTRLYAPPGENVLLYWKNKLIEGYSMPPAPPAPAAAPELLWKFEAGSMMVKMCIKAGNCDINKVADNLLMVDSARKIEFVRMSDGELILGVKQGMFPGPVRPSPNQKWYVSAQGERMAVYDGSTLEKIHDVKYPKGDEGMKSLKQASWIDEDNVLIVFPDKKGNPRKLNAFSCTEGTWKWSFVLPEVADFALTGAQRAKLIGRITMSLVLTAVSASNPMSVGGYGYYAIFVPNLNVAQTTDAGAAFRRMGTDGEREGPAFAAAMERAARCDEMTSASDRSIHFVIGDRGKYEVLLIDRETGEITKPVSFKADKVHGLSPLSAFGVGVTTEDNNRRMRVISLERRSSDPLN